MANLTLEKRLVRKLGDPRTDPGCSVVVYKEGRGGRELFQTLPPGQAFRPGLKDRWFARYDAYGVPADPSLRHRFSRQLMVGVGRARDDFSLKVGVDYRVAHPEVLVERVDRDPLGSLEAGIADVLERRASMLSLQELMDEDFDFEGYVLEVRAHAPRSGEEPSAERFRELAREVGLELLRVEITRYHSSGVIGRGKDIAETQGQAEVDEVALEVNADLEVVRLRKEQEVEPLRQEIEYLKQIGKNRIRSLERGNDFLDSVTGSIEVALANVAKDTGTAHALREAVRELVAARDEIGQALTSPAALPAGSTSSERALPQTGNTVPALATELTQLLGVVDALDCPVAEKSGLAGRILHVLGELCIHGSSADGRLDDYLADLAQFCSSIDVVAALVDERQSRYLQRFRDGDRLRQDLASLSG
jgi:hypothetical protein